MHTKQHPSYDFAIAEDGSCVQEKRSLLSVPQACFLYYILQCSYMYVFSARAMAEILFRIISDII